MQYDVFKSYDASSPIEWLWNLVISMSPGDSTVRCDTSDLRPPTFRFVKVRKLEMVKL